MVNTLRLSGGWGINLRFNAANIFIQLGEWGILSLITDRRGADLFYETVSSDQTCIHIRRHAYPEYRDLLDYESVSASGLL